MTDERLAEIRERNKGNYEPMRSDIDYLLSLLDAPPQPKWLGASMIRDEVYYAALGELCDPDAGETETNTLALSIADKVFNSIIERAAAAPPQETRCGECDQVIEGSHFCFICIQVLKERQDKGEYQRGIEDAAANIEQRVSLSEGSQWLTPSEREVLRDSASRIRALAATPVSTLEQREE